MACVDGYVADMVKKVAILSVDLNTHCVEHHHSEHR